ncbi:hypothetical protein PVA44_06345 [Entomospira nematocerorum]|uniref:Uncharacterized protein n=1 Tax=Entomospira nematocerorum TaxID=2719987 RepID=A0A968GBS6_9SPIO|nr:hypothetical protein [Entomospira nematocera]NIZ46359.1 hypothetical protein [Entomospira nematocera]WDI33836.1 hypothetical protein PVA44_06345 [Entomospira nematocera]
MQQYKRKEWFTQAVLFSIFIHLLLFGSSFFIKLHSRQPVFQISMYSGSTSRYKEIWHDSSQSLMRAPQLKEIPLDLYQQDAMIDTSRINSPSQFDGDDMDLSSVAQERGVEIPAIELIEPTPPVTQSAPVKPKEPTPPVTQSAPVKPKEPTPPVTQSAPVKPKEPTPPVTQSAPVKPKEPTPPVTQSPPVKPKEPTPPVTQSAPVKPKEPTPPVTQSPPVKPKEPTPPVTQSPPVKPKEPTPPVTQSPPEKADISETIDDKNESIGDKALDNENTSDTTQKAELGEEWGFLQNQPEVNSAEEQIVVDDARYTLQTGARHIVREPDFTFLQKQTYYTKVAYVRVRLSILADGVVMQAVMIGSGSGSSELDQRIIEGLLTMVFNDVSTQRKGTQIGILTIRFQ